MAKPFAPEVLLNMVSRFAPANKVEKLQPVVADKKSLDLLSIAERVAQSDASVMVTGPSGSGKEVLSRFIHDNSKRKDGPFVAINCAAIPESMLEAFAFVDFKNKLRVRISLEYVPDFNINTSMVIGEGEVLIQQRFGLFQACVQQ